MFSSSLTEEVKQLEEEIEAVKNKVEDPIICEKIRLFVYAPREIQEMYKADAGRFSLQVRCHLISIPQRRRSSIF